ncbi:MAG: flagellar transcriptional regulator FlhD [Nitrosomonadales bacterium]|nr:flagellar transcriptional regulator FlhD [Nitrosomonadales bacterium]
MNAKQLHEEIKETNLSYMGLVQKMIRTDKTSAMANLGVSDEMADLVAGLTPVQLLKMSSTNLMLCSFHFDENLLFDMITDHKISKMKSARTTKQPAVALAA